MADYKKLEDQLKEQGRELKKLRQEAGDYFVAFRKYTEVEQKISTDALQRVKDIYDKEKEFNALYGKTEDAKKQKEEKRAREALLAQNNLKAFLIKETEGLRNSFKESLTINSLNVSKGMVKGLSTFGLFGKFDTTGLIRKFDEFKAFSKERNERVTNEKLLKIMERMFTQDNASFTDIKAFLKLNGVSESKTSDLMEELTKMYKETTLEVKTQGVKTGLQTEFILDILNKMNLTLKEEEGSFDTLSNAIDKLSSAPSGEITTTGAIIPADKAKKAESKIFFKKEDIDIFRQILFTSKKIYVEVDKHTKLLESIVKVDNEFTDMYSQEMRLTEQDRNRRQEFGKKSKEEKEGGGLFSGLLDSLKGLLSGAGAMIGSALASVAGPLLVVAIGAGLTKLAWDWSTKNANERETKQETELSNKGITRGEEAMAKGYGIDTSTMSSRQEIEEAIKKKRKEGAKYDSTEYKKLTEEEKAQFVKQNFTLPQKEAPSKILEKTNNNLSTVEQRAMSDTKKQVSQTPQPTVVNNNAVTNVKGKEDTYISEIPGDFGGTGY